MFHPKKIHRDGEKSSTRTIWYNEAKKVVHEHKANETASPRSDAKRKATRVNYLKNRKVRTCALEIWKRKYLFDAQFLLSCP